MKIPRPRKGTTERGNIAAKMRRSYEKGASIRDIAGVFETSFGHTRDLLLEAGTTLRPRGGQTR